jgi:hypothetical protein
VLLSGILPSAAGLPIKRNPDPSSMAEQQNKL